MDRHIEESRLLLAKNAIHAKRAITVASLNDLSNWLGSLPMNHPLRPETEARIAQLSAEVDLIAKDLASFRANPSRKELLKGAKARGVARKQVAIEAWPDIHPDRAVERLKKWTTGARYPDGSDGDIGIRAAIRSLPK